MYHKETGVGPDPDPNPDPAGLEDDCFLHVCFCLGTDAALDPV